MQVDPTLVVKSGKRLDWSGEKKIDLADSDCLTTVRLSKVRLVPQRSRSSVSESLRLSMSGRSVKVKAGIWLASQKMSVS